MRTFFGILTCCQIVALFGQPRPDHQTLLDNEAALEVTWGVDRSEYFIGEEVLANVTLANPTNAPLVIVDPFAANARFFELMMLSADRSAVLLMIPGHPASETIRERLPLRTIAPGETIQWSGRSSVQNAFGLRDGPFTFNAVPDSVGRYEMHFRFGRGNHRGRSFRAVGGEVEVAVPVSYRASPQFPGRPDYWLFSIRRGAVSFLCVTVHPFFSQKRILTPRQLVAPSGQVAPFRRIAESPNPIANISVTPSPDGSASIIYTDSAGNQRRVNIDANRMPLTP